jgi:hypothetical protein
LYPDKTFEKRPVASGESKSGILKAHQVIKLDHLASLGAGKVSKFLAGAEKKHLRFGNTEVQCGLTVSIRELEEILSLFESLDYGFRELGLYVLIYQVEKRSRFRPPPV